MKKKVLLIIIGIICVYLSYFIFKVISPLLVSGIEVELPETIDTKNIEVVEHIVVKINEASYLIGVSSNSNLATIKNDEKLIEEYQNIVKSYPKLQVAVKAGSNIKYGRVVKVITILKEAGAEEVGLISTGESK